MCVVRFCLPLFIAAAFWVWFWLILILQYRHHYLQLTGTLATLPVKVMGVNLLDNVHYSLANLNTPAQTNQSEPTACFWESGFIDSVNQLFKWQRRKRLTIKVKFVKNKIFKKEKPWIHVILHPINTIMQRKKINKTVHHPFKRLSSTTLWFMTPPMHLCPKVVRNEL